MSSSTTAPATLTTTAPGVTRRVWEVEVGQYIWHRGAFRRVTGKTGAHQDTLRMGRYALRVRTTVEASA